MLLLAHFVQFK